MPLTFAGMIITPLIRCHAYAVAAMLFADIFTMLH